MVDFLLVERKVIFNLMRCILRMEFYLRSFAWSLSEKEERNDKVTSGQFTGMQRLLD